MFFSADTGNFHPQTQLNKKDSRGDTHAPEQGICIYEFSVSKPWSCWYYKRQKKTRQISGGWKLLLLQNTLEYSLMVGFSLYLSHEFQ
jgi:hypothetical protein